MSRIEFYKIDECKKVTKPWGYELWLQPGSETYPFVLKQLLLKADNQTSLQVHKIKSESIMILSGHGRLLVWDEFFDCDQYLAGNVDVDNIKMQLRAIPLGPGDVFHTPPGTVHRMIADTDLLYVEASTTELDDVIRLQDDQNREHGRIDAEHQ